MRAASPASTPTAESSRATVGLGALVDGDRFDRMASSGSISCPGSASSRKTTSDDSTRSPRSVDFLAVVSEGSALEDGLAGRRSRQATAEMAVPSAAAEAAPAAEGSRPEDDWLQGEASQVEPPPEADETASAGAFYEPYAAQFASRVSRLSLVDLATSAGLWRVAEDEVLYEEQDDSDGEREALLAEARRAFRKLLLEVPSPDEQGLACFPFLRVLTGREAPEQDAAAMTASDAEAIARSLGNGQGPSSSSSSPRGMGGRSGSLLSAVERSALVGHVIACYEAMARELAPNEALLWSAFVLADDSLRGALGIGQLEDMAGCFEEVMGSAEKAGACLGALAERAGEDGELDFVDFLDVLSAEVNSGATWSFRSSLRSSLFQLWGAGGPGGHGGSCARGGVAELRARCAHVSTQSLMSGAAAYQRCLVLHSCWRCEQQLSGLLSARPGDLVGGSCRTVRMLLAMLHGIHSELAPTERALWEIFGRQDSKFRGVLSRSEAGTAVREMLDHAQRRESARQGHSRPVEPTLELRQLREQCCSRFVEELFGNRRSATLADVLRVWWDTDEEYRVAAGLTVPASMVRLSIAREPEEMFREPLRRLATDPGAARASLRGHARTFAELRALAARRAVEDLHTGHTCTASTSEAGDARQEQDL